jgi:hypothetical protein
MCEVRSREKRPKTKKIKYNGQQQKEMDWDEPHSVPNEKMQPIQWTERPTGALVVVGSLWPHNTCGKLFDCKGFQYYTKNIILTHLQSSIL